MKPAKIAILTGNHLCHNPRVIKEATTLAAAGFKVEVIGGWLDENLAKRDRDLIDGRNFGFFPAVRMCCAAENNPHKRNWARAQRAFGARMHRWLGWENRWQLGYGIRQLESAARKSHADLYIAHSEPGLWVASRLKRTGSNVAVDMEDWFSEDLLPEARRQRPLKLLRGLEQDLLRNSAHTSCTSQAMSDALARAYKCDPPTVIYNAFEWRDRVLLDGKIKDRRNPDIPSVHWYSQTLGQGRGLEDLFAALPLLSQHTEIHLRGRAVSGFEDWLKTVTPNGWHQYVYVHDVVTNDELLSRITEHDIGFAGEMQYCRSRDLTVTNKILHYLLAGVAVVASDTTGQREVAEAMPDTVRLYSSGDAQGLARQMNSLLGSAEILREAKVAALHAARRVFCWERQAPTLLRSVEKALAA
jgi:glycosyltransferase involved in cell wall biosynthesis